MGRRWGRLTAAAAACTLVASAGAVPSGTASARRAVYVVDGNVVTAGRARFEVLSPTLIRVEYAPAGRFEDRPTMTATHRATDLDFTTRRSGLDLVITTPGMHLSYRLGSGAFGGGNLTVRLTDGQRGAPAFSPPVTFAGPPSTASLTTTAYVKPDPSYRFPSSGNLGGWYRALDGVSGAVHLHDGLLTTRGWYLLDDSQTVVTTTGGDGYAARPGGDYQDGYLFGYGHDLSQGLHDLAGLVGASPLLPRNAYGVWFSKYAAIDQADYAPLLTRLADDGIGIGVVNVDTDAKAPHVWNGWEWNTALIPHPRRFADQLHRRGISLGLNIHPSIDSDDPKFAATNRAAGGVGAAGGLREDAFRCRSIVFGTDTGVASSGFPPTAAPTAAPTTAPTAGPTGALDCRLFDLDQGAQQRAYLALHHDFERAGVDEFWLDYCCDETAATGAGAADPWINRLYAMRSRQRGSRWPVLSRIGGSLFDLDTDTRQVWAERRSTIQFTGDTQSTWATLAFEPGFTVAAGNVGLPYVSHDIGGFLGTHLPDDLYLRWVQLGALSPVLRLHSNHGDRLPWEYDAATAAVASRFLRLRDALVPYLYTVAAQARTTGLPMTRGLYLAWPRRPAAYRHPGEYLLGPDLLAAPVTHPGTRQQVWFPPGTWTDLFTGQRHTGPRTVSLHVPLGRAPVFQRAGSVLPEQVDTAGDLRQTPTRLRLVVAPGSGSSTLYDDAGDGLSRAHSLTRLATHQAFGETALVIGRSLGRYVGQPRRRSYVVSLTDVGTPLSVRLDGRVVHSWRVHDGALVVRLPPLPTDRRHVLVAQTGGEARSSGGRASG